MKKLIFFLVITIVLGFGQYSLSPSNYQEYNFDNDKPIPASRIINDTAARDLGFLVLATSTVSGGSCFDCHSPRQGGFPDTRQPLGGMGEFTLFCSKLDTVILDKQPVRSGSFVNSWYRTKLLNDGRLQDDSISLAIEKQWHAGSEGHEIVRPDVQLRDMFLVRKLTKKAFGVDILTPELAQMSAIWYEHNAISREAPFQQWLRGEREQLRHEEGFKTLLEKCVDCHSGILFGGNTIDSPLSGNPTELDSILVPSLYSSYWKKDQTYFHNAPSLMKPTKSLRKAIRMHDIPMTETELRDVSKFVYWGLSDKSLGSRLCEPWTKK